MDHFRNLEKILCPLDESPAAEESAVSAPANCQQDDYDPEQVPPAWSCVECVDPHEDYELPSFILSTGLGNSSTMIQAEIPPALTK